MPEGTDHKHIELTEHPVLEGRPLIDRFSQPFLNHDIPVVDFVAEMGSGFDDFWLAVLDSCKLVIL